MYGGRWRARKSAHGRAPVIEGLQGLVSHFNVGIRAGWLNCVVVGADLHRFHHSAAPGEGRNVAATVPLWDMLFGTFQYWPRAVPARFGVDDPSRYPRNHEVLKVLALWLLASPATAGAGAATESSTG